jgi:replicative DNA helicase
VTITEEYLPPEPPPEEDLDPEPTEDTQPPQDLRAEQAVLGSVMISHRALDEIAGGLTVKDFYRPAHGQIWEVITELWAKGEAVDPVTVANELEARGQLTRCGGAPYLHTLTQVVPTASNVTYYSGIVADKAVLRRVREAGLRIRQLAEHGNRGASMADVLAFVRKEVEAATTTGDHDGDVVQFGDLYDAWTKQMAGGIEVGEVVPTPWPEINVLLGGGFHPGRSYLIAARPGAGKTTGGLNIAAGAAEAGFPALVVSAEMSSFEVTGKILAAGGAAEYTEIVKYAMSDETHRRVTEYGESFRDMPLWVIDRAGLTIEYIAQVCRSLVRNSGLALAFLDYLQLVEPTSRKVVREQQVAHISKSIKLLAKELGIPIVTAAQLNRDNSKAGRKPGLSDLRESGSTEQDADVVLMLHHETDEEDRPTGMITMIIAKNRFGRCGEVELRWRGHQARIGD